MNIENNIIILQYNKLDILSLATFTNKIPD